MRHIVTLLCALGALAGTGCRGPAFNLPPAARIAEPGPGVGGPGPGVLTPDEMLAGPAGAAATMASLQSDFSVESGSGYGATPPSIQVMASKPEGMRINFDVSGCGQFDSAPIVSPGRLNFDQPGLYRLKLTRIPGHEGVELYPTLEIAGTTPRSHAFLAHNTVPFQLTPDDLNQVLAGNFVTKAIYLPDPEFQQLAVAGVETLVSTRLDPGLDPIVEADRRGSILAIIRIGNKDIEMPGLEGESNLGYASIVGNSGQGVTQAGHATPAPSAVQPAGFAKRLAGRGCGQAGCSGGYTQGSPYTAGGYGMGAGAMGTGGMNSGGIGAYGPSVGIGGSVAGAYGSPQYGMPHVGTPIGLPGPAHIPLGSPAGLRKHVMHNHTCTYIPDPSPKVNIHLKQHPGVRYPAPRTQAWIHQFNHPTCSH